MELGWIMGIFFGFLTIIYIVVVIFAPEMVGIQGKTARKIEASHHTDDPASDQNEKPKS